MIFITLDIDSKLLNRGFIEYIMLSMQLFV